MLPDACSPTLAARRLHCGTTVSYCTPYHIINACRPRVSVPNPQRSRQPRVGCLSSGIASADPYGVTATLIIEPTLPLHSRSRALSPLRLRSHLDSRSPNLAFAVPSHSPVCFERRKDQPISLGCGPYKSPSPSPPSRSLSARFISLPTGPSSVHPVRTNLTPGTSTESSSTSCSPVVFPHYRARIALTGMWPPLPAA